MAKHLTDRQKKKIIADHVNGMSFRKIGRKYGISDTTVRRVVNGDSETKQKVAQKKEQNTKDMLEFLDSISGKAQQFVEMALASMLDPERMNEASVRELATAMGIVIDKFAKYRTDEDSQTLKSARELLEGVSSVID